MKDIQLKTLRQTDIHTGTWLSINSPIAAEIAAAMQFDWLLFDLEHGLGSEAGLLPMLQATGSFSIAKIVRVGHVDHSLIARALDWGADGIMLPRVESAEKAKACLEFMLYPPHGRRGFSGAARAYNYGLDPAIAAEQPWPLFLPQIETWKGVEYVEEIAALPGVDVLFIGPTDLKADLAAHAPKGIDLDFCIDKVIAAAAKHRKQTGIVLKNQEELHRYKARGIQFLSFGSDLLFLREGLQRARQAFNKKDE